MKHPVNLVYALLPALVFILAWQWAVHGDAKAHFLFASPWLVAQTGAMELTHIDIWKDMGVTLAEAALGLFFGTLLGTLTGLLLWGNGRIDFVVRPYIAFIGSIPIFALAPMTIMWFGIGLLSKVVMAAFAVYFVSLVQAYQGAHAVAAQYLGFARSLAAPTPLIVRKIIVPGAVDWVVAGYKMNVGSALIGAFIAEFVSSEAGLGHYILKASAMYDVPRVLFGVMLMSGLGLFMTGLAWLLQNRWHGRAAAARSLS